MSKLVSSCTHYNAVPATMMEIGDEGPCVVFWLSDGGEDMAAFAILPVNGARDMAKALLDAADAAERGEGRILPPARNGGRA